MESFKKSAEIMIGMKQELLYELYFRDGMEVGENPAFISNG